MTMRFMLMRYVALAGMLIGTLSSQPVAAFMHTGYRGGSVSGGGGSWSGTGFRGGTASGGGGSWHATGAAGGTAAGGSGSWHATGAGGGTASGGGGYWHGTSAYGTTAVGGYNRSYSGYDHYYGGTYAAYHPPTVVNHYYSSGCYDCGGWSTAGAVAAGAAVGTAAGAAATAGAYNAGVAAGSAYTMGAIYGTLPGGCVYSQVGAIGYYKCGGTWFKPSFGANGLYYRVVAAP